jgi:hypothetical protein
MPRKRVFFSVLRSRIIVYLYSPLLQTNEGIEVFPFQHFAAQLAENAL